MQRDHVATKVGVGNGKPCYEVAYINKGLEIRGSVEGSGEKKAYVGYKIKF